MYELQGRDKHGNWDADNVTWDANATTFATLAEAEAELEYWVTQGRSREDLRIVKK